MKVVLILLAGMAVAFGQFDLPTVIYGNAADEFNVLPDDGSASIVLFADGVEAGRAVLNRHPTRNENYRIQISLSTGAPSPSFTVKLERTAGQTGLMEVFTGVSTFTLMPGTVTRYDFIEGEDTDSDGFADGWEELQFAAIEIFEGDPGYDLALLTPDGDYDFDGLSNREEFIAGTFATVFSSQVNFKVLREVSGGQIEMAFDMVTDRTYTVEGSNDLDAWMPVRTEVATTNERFTVSVTPFSFYRIAVR